MDDEITRWNHAQLDSTRHFEEEDRSPEEIVRAVARRHASLANSRETERGCLIILYRFQMRAGL